MVARPLPRQPAGEEGNKRRASAPLPPSSIGICRRASPLARRASPTRTSQWLFGDRGVRAGARESPSGLQGGCLRLPDPPARSRAWWPPRPSGLPRGGVWACPRLPAGRILGGSRRKEGRMKKRRSKGRKDLEVSRGRASSTIQLGLIAGTFLVAPKGQSTSHYLINWSERCGNSTSLHIRLA